MPRTTQKQELAERNDPNAPFLFDEKDIPVRPGVLQAIKDKRYVHTGARLLEDEELAMKLVGLLSMGTGVKKIADSLSISAHTVRAARRELEKQGKLAPYKERVGAIMADIIEAGAQQYRDAVEAGYVQPAQIPVGVGIFSDKKALLDGTPTAIVAQAEDAGAMKAKLDQFLAKLPKATVIEVQPSSDSQSTDSP